MKKDKTLNLILYKDCIEIKKIAEFNTKEGLNKILDRIEIWKTEDRKRNTVKFTIGKRGD